MNKIRLTLGKGMKNRKKTDYLIYQSKQVNLYMYEIVREKEKQKHPHYTS